MTNRIDDNRDMVGDKIFLTDEECQGPRNQSCSYEYVYKNLPIDCTIEVNALNHQDC